ncbi:MAG TPA: MXAN_6652 family MXYO-CTERM-anchored protein [Hyalangium sp.]|nr:MXAN_6652 family MXYO-CTERM-anchored protein [Hyalangium sp.]
MQSQRFFLQIAGVLTACLFSVSAHANLNGIAQRSGKQGAAQSCMAAGCHNVNPGAMPTVELTGPTSLAAGATGNYTLIIRGGAAVRAGMNVAVSNNGGTLNPAAGDLKILAGELTHTAPKNFTGNEARFDFTLVAPSAAGTSKLFASGNSTNGTGSNDGDHSASTTLDVQITGIAPPPGPDPDPKEDEGGCSAAGGAPLLALLALIAAVGLGRRVA